MKTWLIAHVNLDGKTGAAQAQVQASTESAALRKFNKQHPQRSILTIRQKGN